MRDYCIIGLDKGNVFGYVSMYKSSDHSPTDEMWQLADNAVNKGGFTKTVSPKCPGKEV